nr:hypothetical protein [Tanacetum cinerariifolium]
MGTRRPDRVFMAHPKHRTGVNRQSYQIFTAKELWDALVITYSSGKDKLQIFNLHVKANELKQSDKSLEDFWIALQGVWGEIDRTDPNPMKCPEYIKTCAKITSDQKLFQFLNGLDRKFEPIKREILRVDPLPTVEAAYQNILGVTNNEAQGIATGLIAGETKGVGFCFRIVGYPDWWTDGNKKGTKSAKTEKEKVPTTNTSSINKENTSDGRRSDGGFGGLATVGNKRIGGDFSVAEYPPSVNGSAHMAQSSFKKPTGPWIFDCRATDTMTYEDIRKGRIIGRGTEREGLYYVDEVTPSGTVMLAHGTSEREAWLWHRRLGHPSGEEQCDTLSWLRYTSEESCPNQNTTSAGAQEQSSPNVSATEDTVPNLISEVSNSQPSDSLDEIPKIFHETVGVQEHEEPTLTEVPEKYILPARSNRGIPQKRYTPEKTSRSAKYAIANIARVNLSKEAKAFSASLYSEEAPSNVEQALKSEKWNNVMDVEMDALMRNGTWNKCILPQGKKPV